MEFGHRAFAHSSFLLLDFSLCGHGYRGLFDLLTLLQTSHDIEEFLGHTYYPLTSALYLSLTLLCPPFYIGS